MPRVTLGSVFKKLDRDGDGQVSRDELTAFCKKAKVDSGLLGGFKLRGTVDSAMDAFDADRDGAVSRREFAANAATLIPLGIKLDRAKARRDPAHVNQAVSAFVAMLDHTRDARLDEKELAAGIEGALKRQGESMAGTKAEVSARLAIHTIDADGDKKLDADELADFAAAAVKGEDD